MYNHIKLLIALTSVAALIGCGDTPEQRRGATGERCFIDDDCREGLICAGALGGLGGLGGQANTSGLGGLGGLGDAGLSGPRCVAPASGGLAGGAPGQGVREPDGQQSAPDEPDQGGPIEDAPTPDQELVDDREQRTYRIDTLNLSAPPLEEFVGVIQNSIVVGDTHILLQVTARTFNAQGEPAAITLGPGEPVGDNVFVYKDGLEGSTDGVVNDAGEESFQMNTTQPLALWNLEVNLDGGFIIPVREVSFPIAGVLSGRIQKAELTGLINRDDAKEVFLPTLGLTLADLLANTPADLDTDGDGATDSWTVRGEFSGGEVEFAR